MTLNSDQPPSASHRRKSPIATTRQTGATQANEGKMKSCFLTVRGSNQSIKEENSSRAAAL